MKRIIAIILAAVMVFSLAACASDSGNGKESGKKTDTKTETEGFKIEDLEWTAEEGIVDGERVLTFAVTNNSKYTIKEITIAYREKEGITEDQIEAFWKGVKSVVTTLGGSDDDYTELREEATEISLKAEIDNVVNVGETNKTGRIYYFSGIVYCKDASALDVVEPDIATIEYVDDNIIKTLYYDFKSAKYTEDSSTEKAFEWSTHEIGNKLPKPDVKIVSVLTDDEDSFSFYAYGVTTEMFEKYIEMCKEQGFTINADTSTFMKSYEAENEAGDEIDIMLDEKDREMSVDIDLGDTEPTESEADEETP